MKHSEESADSENEPWSKKLLNPKNKPPWQAEFESRPKFKLSSVFDPNLSFEAHGKSFMVNQTLSTACPDLSSLNALDESLVFNSGTLGLTAHIPEESGDYESEPSELGGGGEAPVKKKKKQNILKKIQNTFTNLFKRKKKKRKKSGKSKKKNSKSSKKTKSGRKSWRAKSKGRKVNLNSCLEESFMTANAEDTRNFEGVNFKGEEILQNE